jgi:hypothetical protein
MSLLLALKRIVVGLLSRTWVIAVVTVIICAGFIAHAVGSIVAAETLNDAPALKLPPAPPKPIIAAKTKLDGRTIRRNIFCSTCNPDFIEGDLGLPVQYTGEPAVLIATSLGIEPRATVRVLASEAQGSWGVGERIPGVGMIDRIGSTSIDVVDVAGHRGTLSLLEAEAAGRQKSTGAATPDPATPAQPYADRVRKVAENDYEVDRTLVREFVTGGAKPGEARAIPQMKGNEVNGIRLLGVKNTSVAAALGLKSNDVIANIDGEPIKNVQQLLDLYAKIDQLSAIELTGTRAGKPLTLTLRLR